jgi:hypothetical protein
MSSYTSQNIALTNSNGLVFWLTGWIPKYTFIRNLLKIDKAIGETTRHQDVSVLQIKKTIVAITPKETLTQHNA